MEISAWRRVHLLCLRSIFLAKMCSIFSADLYSCHSSSYFSFCSNNRQSHYFKSLKEALSVFANDYMVQAPPNSMETLNSLVFFNLVGSEWNERNQRTVDKTPGFSFSIPKLSIPLISAITAHPNCFNPAVTSLMPLLSPDLLVFPFTDVLSLVLSTARLIKALVLW